MRLSPTQLTFICLTWLLVSLLFINGSDAQKGKKKAPAPKAKAKPKPPVKAKPTKPPVKLVFPPAPKKICRQLCPEGYKSNEDCHCVLQYHVGRKCEKAKTCGEGYALNDHCECVPVIRDPIEDCAKTCPAPLVLDKNRCLCTCQSFCTGNYEVDPITCKCVCNVECRFDLALDPTTCSCEPLNCKPGFAPKHGKCVPQKKNACQKGELQIEHECVQIEHCPPGYKRRPNRVCERICRRGVGTGNRKMCGPALCGPSKYVINGICKHVVETSCPDRSFFDFIKPGCPSTCKEPVPLAICRETWSGPGCACFAGFVYHNGHCIHPSDCPNKHYCVRHGDVAFLLDSSPSIGRRNFDLMKTLTASMIQTMNLYDGTCHRLLVATYHTKMEKVLDFHSYKDLKKHEMLERVLTTKYEGGASHLGEVLREFRSVHFVPEKGLRDRVPRILILMTDGAPNQGMFEANHQARLVREAGIQLIIIKLGKYSVEEAERVERLAGMTGEDSVYALHGYHDVRKITNRVISFRCTEFNCPSPRIIRHPCQGEFRYSDRIEFFKGPFYCQPRVVKNVEKHRCKCPPPTKTISPCVNDFRIVNKTEWELNTKTEQCVPKINQVQQICACAKTQIKRGVCQGIFLPITINREVLMELPNGRTFCQKRTTVIKEVCGCPKTAIDSGHCVKDTRIATVKRYRFIRSKKLCIANLQNVTLKCDCPPPSVATRTCTDDNIEVKVTVPRLTLKNKCVDEIYVGVEPCKRLCPKKIDVGMIIDTSSSVTEEMFAEIKDFVKSLVDILQISYDGVRASLITYASNRKVHMIGTFLTYIKPLPLQDRIDSMKLIGGRANIAEALKTYREVGIIPSQGNRRNESVPQILYLITDGDTKGQLNPIIEADHLKAMGVRIVVISVGRTMNVTEASQLVSHPAEHNMIQVNTSDLEDIVQQVADLRCRMEKDVDDLTVRQDYYDKLKKRSTDVVDESSEQLNGADFKKLERVHSHNLARIYWTFEGNPSYLTVGKFKKFYNRLKIAIAKQTRSKVFQVMDLKITRGDKPKTTKVHLKMSNRFAYRLADLVKAKKFHVLDNKKRVCKYDPDIIVISADAIAAVHFTEELDSQTRVVFKVLRTYVHNEDFIEKIMKSLHKIDDMSIALARLVRKDEDATIKMVYKMLAECLRVIRDSEAALQAIYDEENREMALSHIEYTLKEALDIIHLAIRKGKQSQGRAILRQRAAAKAKAAKGKAKG